MRIWLDDLRDPKDYGYPEATWLKSYQEWLDFISLPENFNKVESIHFDNDLGEVFEGYHAFQDVECMLYSGEWEFLKEMYVHTSNPSAAQKFMLAKESMLRYGVQMIRKNY